MASGQYLLAYSLSLSEGKLEMYRYQNKLTRTCNHVSSEAPLLEFVFIAMLPWSLLGPDSCYRFGDKQYQQCWEETQCSPLAKNLPLLRCF